MYNRHIDKNNETYFDNMIDDNVDEYDDNNNNNSKIRVRSNLHMLLKDAAS